MPDNDFRKDFGKRLKDLMDSRNMTQAELSRRMNVGSTSVYNWVSGIKIPRIEKIDEICKIFGCKREDLLRDVHDDHVVTVDLDPEQQLAVDLVISDSDLMSFVIEMNKATPEYRKRFYDFAMSMMKENIYRKESSDA